MLLHLLTNFEIQIYRFYKQELEKTNQTEFRIEQEMKKKDDKLYVKWNGYDNSFNSSIDKEDILIIYIILYERSGENKKVVLDLSIYATEADLKRETVFLLI